jgi:putative membrane protein
MRETPATDTPRPRRGPALFTDDLEPLTQTPFDAPQPDDPGLPAEGAAAQAVRAAARRGSVLGTLFWGAVAALVGLGLSVAAYDFLAGMVARNPVLGTVAGGLLAIVTLGLALFALRELAATARLGKVDAIREGARRSIETNDLAEAQKALRALRRLYSGRADLHWGLDHLRGREADLLDGPALLGEAETALMGPLDPRAESAVGSCRSHWSTCSRP